jgi:alpha-beta hydrolase superfamily lysophospholipase
MSDLDVIQSERSERASDGQRLHAYEWSSRASEQTHGALIVLMHGYAEHAGRYREFAEFLVRAGHVVHAFDARGHGQSAGQRGHVENFDRYVEDYYDFAQGLKQRYPDRPLIMLGHSNGGLIALRTLQSRPRLADGLIVISPLVALQKAHVPVPVWLAAILARVAGRFPVLNGLKAHELTHDSRKLEQHERDRLNHIWSTPSWYVSVHDAMNHAFANIDSVRLPVLVLEAERDPIVVPDAIRRLFQAVPSADKELIVVRDAFHEVLNEVGRANTYGSIGAWIGARWKASAAA